jgi:hypothetical protein
MVRALFNLNVRCGIMLFFSDEKDVNLMRRQPVHPLKVK